jgi:nucleoside-diphosphate-sugar epimerase
MIAVTGANGLLGSFIVRKLLEHKKSFVAIKRAGSDTSLLADVEKYITWKNADILNAVELEEALEGATSVIHAAAMVSFNPAHERKIFHVNVTGTGNVVNACLAANIKRLVHISSVAALGRQKGQSLIDETNKWVESSVNSTYAESKYLAELEVFRGQEEGLSTVIVNPSVILAAADWTKSSAKLFKYVWDQRPYYINGSLNYVDVRDVAEITAALLELPVEAERFIVNASSISFIDFFTMMADKLNKKPPSIRLNKTLLSAVAAAETFRALLTGSEPLISRETARLAGTSFRYDNTKIKTTLNFDFKSIDSTLAWCCTHYLNFNAKK